MVTIFRDYLPKGSSGSLISYHGVAAHQNEQLYLCVDFFSSCHCVIKEVL